MHLHSHSACSLHNHTDLSQTPSPSHTGTSSSLQAEGSRTEGDSGPQFPSLHPGVCSPSSQPSHTQEVNKVAIC